MIKILELFSGYGTASFALKRLGLKHKVVAYSDIDKYANQCFQQNHGGKELGDVRNINPNDLEDFDLLTAGFPCQSFSMAGKMQGEADPRGTLFYEIIRIAEVKKPKFMLLENVKGLTTKKFESTFKKILSELNRIGYNVYWKVLNSKDFGIPQSRARVWFVCFRKDIDEPMRFQFPIPVPLKIFIKDILEENVDKKYYLSPLLQERFAKYLEEKKTKIMAMRGRENTQQLEQRKDNCSNSLTSIQKDNLVFQSHRANEIREYEGIHPTLTESHEHRGGTNASIVYDNKNCLGTIPITCQKRTFETPKEINEYLKECNHYTIKELAKLLNLPKTQVEHYFRTDNSRAIPSPEIWIKLKDLLGFDDKYDKQVTEIYNKEIEFEQTRRVWNSEGTSPTLNTIQEPIVYDRKGFDSRTKGFRENELSPTLSTKMGTGGNNVPMIIGTTKSDTAMGTNSRSWVHNINGIIGCISSTTYKQPQQILEPLVIQQVTDAIDKQGNTNQPKILDLYNRKADNNISITLSEPHHNNLRLMNENKLRRLTPKECFRLMGFLNDEINLNGLSDTQKYKLAGNGQDVNMVSKIFKNMFEVKNNEKNE